MENKRQKAIQVTYNLIYKEFENTINVCTRAFKQYLEDSATALLNALKDLEKEDKTEDKTNG